MAISLTTDGLRLDYRTTVQKSASGTYPIGTVIVTGSIGGYGDGSLRLPGTWAYIDSLNGAKISSLVNSVSLAVRLA